MVFVGVTTGGSLINRLFPVWAEIMGIAPAQLEGHDLPLDVTPDRVCAAIQRIADDPAVRGALVTTHKIAVHRHARHLFSSLDRDADRLGEVSAVAKTRSGLVGHAMDVVTAGLALDRIVGRRHWRDHPAAEALILGSGGAGIALSAHLAERRREERPAAIILSDVDSQALAHAKASLDSIAGDGLTTFHEVGGAEDGDRLMAALPPGSLVVNATGLGKDRPGSPISDAATFPDRGVVWEFNYRGPRRFLAQARKQAADFDLTIADGWTYFLYGWAHVIAEIFGVALDKTLFARLESAASALKAGDGGS